MADHPKITVVTPSFNQAAYLEEAICSVLGQGYPNLEYMVLDGGSTDGSAEIIQKYADRLAFWTSGPDGGQAAAINGGFARSTGDILCWLNSDDLYMPRALFHAAEALRVGACDFIYGGCLCFHEGAAGNSARNSWPIPFDAELLTYKNYIDQPSAFWTRALWERVGPLNKEYDYAFDWEWWIRASKVCELRPVDRHLSLYRFHGEHKTGTGGVRRLHEVSRIIDAHSPLKLNRAYERALDHGAQWAQLFHEMLNPRQVVRQGAGGPARDKLRRMEAVLQRLASEGVERVALYGAGQHTREVVDVLVRAPVEIVGIVDDAAAGRLAGWPIVRPEHAVRLGAEAVVLSSDAHEERMWRNRDIFTDRGMRVVRLYGQASPTPPDLVEV